MQSEKLKSSKMEIRFKDRKSFYVWFIKWSMAFVVLLVFEIFMFKEILKIIVSSGVDFLFTDSWINQTIPDQVISHEQAVEIREALKPMAMLLMYIACMVILFVLFILLFLNAIIIFLITLAIFMVGLIIYIYWRIQGKTHEEAKKIAFASSKKDKEKEVD